MEGDAFDVLDAAQELVEGDVALLVAGNLRADAVVLGQAKRPKVERAMGP